MFNLFKKKPTNFQHIDFDEFSQLKGRPDHVVLDVRSPGEVAAGAIPGHRAINVSDASFRDKVSRLDKSRTYLVYCRSGMRSAKACRIMAELGFGKLYNFKGGIMAWNAHANR